MSCASHDESRVKHGDDAWTFVVPVVAQRQKYTKYDYADRQMVWTETCKVCTASCGVCLHCTTANGSTVHDYVHLAMAGQGAACTPVESGTS